MVFSKSGSSSPWVGKKRDYPIFSWIGKRLRFALKRIMFNFCIN